MRLLNLAIFPKDTNKINFAKSSSLIRLCLGLILCHRFIDLCISSPINSTQEFKHLIGLFLSFFTTIGFLTPIILPFSSLFNLFISTNLGGQITAITLILIFLGKGWRYVSIDSKLMSLYALYYRFIRIFEIIDLKPEIARTFCIWLWGGVCISAMSFHFTDKSWLTGTAVMTLLRTPYLNDYYGFFTNLNDSFFLLVSSLSLYGMAIWELILWAIPGLRIIRNITFWWGIAFFISSIIFINLSYLSYIEVIFWIGIYKPNFVAGFLSNKEKEFLSAEDKNSKLRSFIKKFLEKGLIFLGIFSILSINIGNLIHLFGNTREVRIIGYKIKSNRFSAIGGRLFGQAEVNVFNQQDLMMNQYSTLICRINKNGTKSLVPFQDSNGGRLDYLANDKFYFTNSLKFQRWSKGKTVEEITGLWLKLSMKVVEFDYHLNHKKGINYYRILLLEHQPNYINDNVLAGWNVKKNPLVRKEIKVNSDSLLLSKVFRFSLPPGHFNESSRIKRSAELYCDKK